MGLYRIRWLKEDWLGERLRAGMLADEFGRGTQRGLRPPV